MLVPRFPSPRFMVNGVDVTVDFPVYEEGALAAPASGTYTLYKGTTSQFSGAVTVASDIATRAVALSTLGLSQDVDYVEEWELVIDGETYTFRRDVYIVRRDLYPVVTDQDLIRVHSNLASLRPSTLDSYESYREEAWDQIVGRLLGLGNLPQLITNSWVFRTSHLWLTLSLIAIDFATEESGLGKWTKSIERYEKKYQAAWDAIQLEYDTDEDGAADQRKSGIPVYFLTGLPQRFGGGIV